MLDVTHHPSHFNAAFDSELSSSFHLPSSSRATPWADFCKTSLDNNLVEVDKALKVRELLEGVLRLHSGEVELMVSSRSDSDLLVQSLRVNTVDDLEFSRVLHGDCTSQGGSRVEVASDLGGNVSQVRQSVHTTTQIGPDRLDLRDVEQERVHQTQDVERHLFGREGSDTHLLDTFGDNIGRAHQTGTSGPTNDGTCDTQVFSPAFGRPSVEQSLETDLAFGVKTVVTKETVVGRQGQNDLSRSGDEVSVRLLGLDSSHESEHVDQHQSMRQFRSVIDTIDFSAIFGQSGERNDVVEIDGQSRVDVLYQGFNILLGSTVEGYNHELGTLGTELVEDVLVVVDRFPRVSRGGNDDGCTTSQQTLQDFNTDTAFADTGHQGSLFGESGTSSSDFGQDVKVDVGKLLAVCP